MMPFDPTNMTDIQQLMFMSYMQMSQNSGPTLGSSVSNIGPMAPPRLPYTSNPFGNSWWSSLALQLATQGVSSYTGGQMYGNSGRSYSTVMRDMERYAGMRHAYAQSATQNASTYVSMISNASNLLGMPLSPATQMKIGDAYTNYLAPAMGPIIGGNPELARMLDIAMGYRGSAEAMAGAVFPAASYMLDPKTGMQISPADAAAFSVQLNRSLYSGGHGIQPKHSALQMGKLYSYMRTNGMLADTDPSTPGVAEFMDQVSGRQGTSMEDLDYLDEENRKLFRASVVAARKLRNLDKKIDAGEELQQSDYLRAADEALIIEARKNKRFDYLFDKNLSDEDFNRLSGSERAMQLFEDSTTDYRSGMYNTDTETLKYDKDEMQRVANIPSVRKHLTADQLREIEAGPSSSRMLALAQPVATAAEKAKNEALHNIYSKDIISSINSHALADLSPETRELVDKLSRTSGYGDFMKSVDEFNAERTLLTKEEADAKNRDLEQRFESIAKEAGVRMDDALKIFGKDETIMRDAKMKAIGDDTARQMRRFTPAYTAGQEFYAELGGDPEDTTSVVGTMHKMFGELKSKDPKQIARELRELKDLANTTGTGLAELVDMVSGIAKNLRGRGLDPGSASALVKSAMGYKQALLGTEFAISPGSRDTAELIDKRFDLTSAADTGAYGNNVGTALRMRQRDLESGVTDSAAIALGEAIDLGETSVTYKGQTFDISDASTNELIGFLSQGDAQVAQEALLALEGKAFNMRAYTDNEGAMKGRNKGFQKEASRISMQSLHAIGKTLQNAGVSMDDAGGYIEDLLSGKAGVKLGDSKGAVAYIQKQIQDSTGVDTRKARGLAESIYAAADLGIQHYNNATLMDTQVMFSNEMNAKDAAAQKQAQFSATVSKGMENRIDTNMYRAFAEMLRTNEGGDLKTAFGRTFSIGVDMKGTVIGDAEKDTLAKMDKLKEIQQAYLEAKTPKEQRALREEEMAAEADLRASLERFSIAFNYGLTGKHGELKGKSKEEQMEIVYGSYFEKGTDGKTIQKKLDAREYAFTDEAQKALKEGRRDWDVEPMIPKWGPDGRPFRPVSEVIDGLEHIPPPGAPAADDPADKPQDTSGMPVVVAGQPAPSFRGGKYDNIPSFGFSAGFTDTGVNLQASDKKSNVGRPRAPDSYAPPPTTASRSTGKTGPNEVRIAELIINTQRLGPASGVANNTNLSDLTTVTG